VAQVHASESQHWYARDGSPAYEVKGANGNMRPATLRDARKLGLVPSVTTIIGSCAKPGLERWKLEQMMHAALTLPRLDGEPEAEWISRVWTDSKETARKAAERGTAIHAALQNYLVNSPIPPQYEKHVLGACGELDATIGLEWDCVCVESPFAHPSGFGGKTDLLGLSPSFILDFKTKEFGPGDDLKTWDEHAMQIAAYRVGQEMPDARGFICYVSVTHPGLARCIEIKQDEMLKGWAMFQGLLAYWKAKNAFDPSWSEEVVASRELTEAKA
jgi:hypothetical protein